MVLSTSDANIAKISDGKVVILGGGTVTITARQSGNENYLEATPRKQVFEISKLTQSLVVNEIPEKTFRNPSFLLEIETTSSLTLKITSSNRNIASVKDKRVTIHRAGEVDITVELSGSNMYEKVTVVRKLIIRKADQGIQFNELPEISFGDEGFSLTASTTSFLPVAITSSNALVATVDAENFVHIVGPGETTLTATQPGNHNYNSAEPVARLLKVNSVTGIESCTYTGVSVYPNPVDDYLILKAVHPIETLSLTDAKGVEIKNVSASENRIDMRSCSSGIYFLKFYSS